MEIDSDIYCAFNCQDDRSWVCSGKNNEDLKEVAIINMRAYFIRYDKNF